MEKNSLTVNILGSSFTVRSSADPQHLKRVVDYLKFFAAAYGIDGSERKRIIGDVLELTDPGVPDEGKSGIWVVGRQHPGEPAENGDGDRFRQDLGQDLCPRRAHGPPHSDLARSLRYNRARRVVRSPRWSDGSSGSSPCQFG